MIPPQAIPIQTPTISCLTSDLHANSVGTCHVVVFRRHSFPYQNTRTWVSFCARRNGSSNVNNELKQVFADQYGGHVSFCDSSGKRATQWITQKLHLYRGVWKLRNMFQGEFRAKWKSWLQYIRWSWDLYKLRATVLCYGLKCWLLLPSNGAACKYSRWI